MVQMDLPAAGESAERDELLLLSVRSFVEEHFELPGCWLRTLLYNDAVALLAGLENADQLYPLMAELERLCALAPNCLGLGLTVGLGQLCATAGQVRQSMEGAIAALDYRLLMGGGRVLYIGDLEPDASLRLSLDDEDQRALATAVKLGTEEQLDATLHGLLDRVRASRLPPAQCQLYVLEIVTCLVRLARSGGVEVEDVFGPDFAGAVPAAQFASLDRLGSGSPSASAACGNCWAAAAPTAPAARWTRPRPTSPPTLPTATWGWRRCASTCTFRPPIFPPCSNGRPARASPPASPSSG